MKIRTLLFACAAIAAATLPTTSVAAQVTQPGLWPEKPLSPVQQELKQAVIVLRDTLRAVDATVSRLERAHAAGTTSVVAASGRTLASDCARAARGAAVIQNQVKGHTTSARWGDLALARYRLSLDSLRRVMSSCSTDLTTGSPAHAVLVRVGLSARAAVDQYEVALDAMLRTLSIPLDPKGHKSAIEL